MTEEDTSESKILGKDEFRQVSNMFFDTCYDRCPVYTQNVLAYVGRDVVRRVSPVSRIPFETVELALSYYNYD